jgi:formylglycine-generating enzyme required for sulfatase activity
MKAKGRRIAITAGAVALVVLASAVVLGWRDLVFWYRFEALGTNAQGYSEYRHRQTGIIFVRLPGGTFLMGAQDTDPNDENYFYDVGSYEEPVHEVRLSPFLLGKYEVTQAQWTMVMGSNPSEFKGDDNRPVECVSWDDIQRFEAKTGLSLPTEAQWEYASRVTVAPALFKGKPEDMAWCKENSEQTTHPVGLKEPNGFGIHDMYGNILEWCADVFDKNFYKKPEARRINPFSDRGSEYRVFRGGCFAQEAKDCYSFSRNWSSPAGNGIDVGFRSAAKVP